MMDAPPLVRVLYRSRPEVRTLTQDFAGWSAPDIVATVLATLGLTAHQVAAQPDGEARCFVVLAAANDTGAGVRLARISGLTADHVAALLEATP